VDPDKLPKLSEATKWMKDAYSCTFGDYQFVVPAEGTESLVLKHNGKPLALVSPDGARVEGTPDLRVVVLDRDHDGHFDTISYETWRDDRHVSVDDWNLDGQADLRTTAAPRNGEKIHEVWVGGAWRRYETGNGMWISGHPNLRLKLDGDRNFTIVDESKR